MHSLTGAIAVILSGAALLSCKATQPGRVETTASREIKELAIGGEDWKNPTPDTPESIDTGTVHFRHHCQICHGLDGQNTGVPFADKMSPPAADLASKRVQDYKDGQLKWIIENGIRFSGMPGWKGILSDEEMWAIVRYVRNLPAKGSVGVPEVYRGIHSGAHGTKAHEH